MAQYEVSCYRVEVTRLEGLDSDDRDEIWLDFTVGDLRGRTNSFAIFRPESEPLESAVMTVDPESSGVPLVVAEWAVRYARSEL